MLCPSCKNPPMSLGRWLIAFDPMHVQCRQCSSKLIPTPRWRRRYYGMSVFAMLIVITPSILVYFSIIPYTRLMLSFYIALGLALIFLISLSFFFWKQFEYKVDIVQH